MRLATLTTFGILTAAALFAASPASAAWGHPGGPGFAGGWHGGFGGWHGAGFHGGWGGAGFRAGWGGFHGGWAGYRGFGGWGYHGWGWGYPGFRVRLAFPAYGYGYGYPVAPPVYVAPVYHPAFYAPHPVIITHAVHHVAYVAHHGCGCACCRG
jgi:hypothetical protein